MIRDKENHNIELNNLTRESLVTAVILLMETMPYEKITITDICKKAGVSRNAFYRHYPKKDAIIRYYLFQITEEYRKNLRKKGELVTAYDLFHALLVHMAKHKELIYKILSADLQYILIDTIFLAFRDWFRYEHNHYKECHFAGSFYAICIYWLFDDAKRSAEDVADLILQYNHMDRSQVFRLLPVTDKEELMSKYHFIYRD